MKTLAVFDFDDTLFNSGARVIVQKPGQAPTYLSTHEYAVYVPEKDDEFDFSEFSIYPPRPEPIAQTTRALQSAVLRHGLENVIILTARGRPGPVEKVLENFQMPPVEVIAIGSSNPDDKAQVLNDLIDQVGYDRLVLYEDSIPNIAAIRKRIQPILGKMFFAYQVIPTKTGVRVKKISR
tara:strand:+ start:510 stop:1049 length:540 start_codon:yes stop_codon:yes gene_type:complete